jgi:hypothetical protein
VDPATGADFTLSPRDINWTLVRRRYDAYSGADNGSSSESQSPMTFKPAATESKRYLIERTGFQSGAPNALRHLLQTFGTTRPTLL